ncbi:MAG: TetR/AcrR family transcriptional regulator C-terminal domain-containing protein [Phormidesmis sp.]
MAKTNHSNQKSRVPLSRERVLRTAIRLADEGGIEVLSMRKLAQALGVKAMSLYNHVVNKDDILDGIVDMVIGEIEVPDINSDWKVAMRRRAISAHEVLLRHPWASLPIVSRINVGPAMFRYVDATLGCLLEAGFSGELADRAWNALDSHIYGFTLQALNFPIAASEYATTAADYLPMIPADQYPYMHKLSVQVAEGHYDGVANFEFGLDLIIESLDRCRPS